jgi:diaminohydroxyphosphoribosylaminopyrimidine deaminase/5-amino-6-(5-phosphoribosylamino)uracil reductase
MKEMPTQNQSAADVRHMHEALRLAGLGRGYVSPNPMVGAVLVRKGKVVASGYHRYFGGPHAEVDCLAAYRGELHNATLFVTLEPCSHYGKTPPCADLLASTGLRRVVVAMRDPNPLVSGRGVAQLRKAGIRVEVGLLDEEARALNLHFLVGITKRRPYVHVKIAQSLDGMIAGVRRNFRWISGPESRALVHTWRAQYDAVLVGAGTIRADDPRLTARGGSGRDPDVVILDGWLRIPDDARVLRTASRRRVIICATRDAVRKNPGKVRRLAARGVLLLSPGGRGGRLRIPDLMAELYAQEIGSILVEGGSQVFREFLEAGIVDELSIFVAPQVIGGGVPAFASTRKKFPASFRFRTVQAGRVGGDILIRALL